MYNVVNKDSIYVAGYFGWRREYQIYEIGDERALIRFLASHYVDLTWCEGYKYYSNNAYDCEYFDGYNRNINPRNYEADALDYYEKYLKNQDKSSKRYFNKNHVYHNVFRYDPVPHTHKWHGGPCCKARKRKHIAAMWANPEYKGFNRGSRKDYDMGYWDDWYRHVERCWKSQSKKKHQWE